MGEINAENHQIKNGLAATTATDFVIKLQLDAIGIIASGVLSSGVFTTRNLIAGSGLAGGGTLAADRTFNVGTADGTIIVNPDTIQVGVITTANITNNAVDNTKIRDSVGTSVIGRSAGTTGDPADIAASASGQFLRRDGVGVLGFGAIVLSDLPSGINAGVGGSSIPTSRNLVAGSGLFGGGDLSADRTFNVGAIDGTIVVNPDSIQVGTIQNTNIRNSVATSVVGRSANSLGLVSDITATASGQFLKRDGSNIVLFSGIVFSDLPPISFADISGVVPISRGGTSNITANAAINALLDIGLGQVVTFVLSDNVTNTAPTTIVRKHISSSTVTNSFGIAEATDLQNASGILKRVLTDSVLFVTATNASENVRKEIQIMVAGALQPCVAFGYRAGINAPAIYFGSPASDNTLGFVSATMQMVVGATLAMQWTASAITSNLRHNFPARAEQARGANVASATTITAGNDGNLFPLTGVTTVSGLVTTNWQNGSEVVLEVPSGIRIAHNSPFPGASAVNFQLRDSTDITTTKTTLFPFRFNGTSWYEVGSPTFIVDGSITTAKLRNSVGTSVIGRAANSTGVPADIQALASGHFLRRDGTGVLGFGTILLSDLPAGIGGGGGGGGDVFSSRSLIAGAGLTGGGNLSADRTFDVVTADGTIIVNPDSIQVGTINTGNIANNAVDKTKLNDSVATSVIGRSANSSGDPADIQATASGQFLRRDGNNVLGFGAISTFDLPNSVTTISGINLIAGAGLIGGGNLTTNRTFDVATADTTIVVAADSIRVGVITDSNITNNTISSTKLHGTNGPIVLGRDNSGAGQIQELGLRSPLAAISGDDEVVIRTAGFSVVGKSTTGTGNVGDITATTSGQFLNMNGSSLAFRSIVKSDIPTLDYSTVLATYQFSHVSTGNIGDPGPPDDANAQWLAAAVSDAQSAGGDSFEDVRYPYFSAFGHNASSWSLQIQTPQDFPDANGGVVNWKFELYKDGIATGNIVNVTSGSFSGWTLWGSSGNFTWENGLGLSLKVTPSTLVGTILSYGIRAYIVVQLYR